MEELDYYLWLWKPISCYNIVLNFEPTEGGYTVSTDLLTYRITIHFLSRATVATHHRLQYSHPALFIGKAGSHEVQGLARPAGGVGMRLQFQHIRDVYTYKKIQIGLQFNNQHLYNNILQYVLKCTWLSSVD